jgi:exonuclease III
MAFSRAALALLAALWLPLACKSRSAAKAAPEGSLPAEAAGSQPLQPWWVSPDDCRRSLASRPARAQGKARIGTWNIRWFPDGEAGDEREEEGTNIEWLACGVAHLDVDVLALQEFKAYAEAKPAIEQLIAALDRHTTGRWKLELEKCGKPEEGHVGLLWNASRVEARDFRESNEVLAGHACDADWRPALAAYFEFPGGFDTHVVVLHAVAGESRERMQLRERAFRSFPDLQRAAYRSHADTDLIVTGDFNTSGCAEGCEPKRTPASEIARLRELLELTKPALRLIPPTIDCSEYHDDRPYLLDHFAVSATTRELGEQARAAVDGYCTETRCSSEYDVGDRDIYDALSDHCPVVLEFEDRDLD